jgi:hypothetical protein
MIGPPARLRIRCGSAVGSAAGGRAAVPGRDVVVARAPRESDPRPPRASADLKVSSGQDLIGRSATIPGA